MFGEALAMFGLGYIIFMAFLLSLGIASANGDRIQGIK